MVKVIDSRNEIGKHIKLPDNPIIAEIGVFKGEFANILNSAYNPSLFYLIDPWEECNIVSGDQDGNNVSTYHGKDLYNHVNSTLGTLPNIKILRKYSTSLSDDDIPKETLDFIYIDGDHSYEGVKRDLNLANTLVKSGGWIAGHDYSMNPLKAKNHYEFGVKQAVYEFCKSNNLSVSLLMNDGCMSFAIKK